MEMPDIEMGDIENAIRGNVRVDGSERILQAAANAPAAFLEPFPPVLIAGFQETDQGRSDRVEAPIASTLDFEYLSLEIRRRALAIQINEPSNELPWIASDNKILEIRAEVLVDVIRKASFFSAETEQPNRFAGAHHGDGAGLQLVGLLIVGDLNLSNLKLPFSLRFVCCWIKGAVRLNRSEFLSLELSGSVVEKGVFGTHCHASGAIRMRRTVCLGPVDFGGAEINGVFDASDSVLLPKNEPPKTESFVGDRGQLNLAMAKIDKQMRLNRIRLYGGINMRDCSLGGSLFMNDAVLRAPMAVVEKLGFDALRESSGRLPSDVPAVFGSSVSADEILADLIWPVRRYTLENMQSSLVRLELLNGKSLFDLMPCTEARKSDRLLRVLLSESTSARTSALRAENANIGGSVFARSARFSGRVKMKGVNIVGGAHMNGVRLRTIASLSAGFAYLSKFSSSYPTVRRVCELREETKEAVRSLEPKEKDEHVLDLKNAKIGGALDLSFDRRGVKSSQFDNELIDAVCEVLCRLTEDSAKFAPVFFGPESQSKTLNASDLLSELWEYDLEKYENLETDRPTHLERPLVPSDHARVAKIVKKNGGQISSSLLIGEIVLVDAEIAGGVNFEGLIANIFGMGSSQTGLILDRSVVGGNVDLRNTVGLRAICAKYIKISGSLLLADKPKYRLVGKASKSDDKRQSEDDTWDPMRGRALFVAGILPNVDSDHPLRRKIFEHDFEGAKISGDAVLIFDRSQGPRIDLAAARVAGSLVILPALAGLELSDREFENDMYEADLARRWRSFSGKNVYKKKHPVWICRREKIIAAPSGGVPENALKRARDRKPSRPTWLLGGNYKLRLPGYREPVPEIDLRQASASVFSQPPSAWPKQDGLIILGFEYKSCSGYGPLGPKRRSGDLMRVDTELNRRIIEMSFAILLVSILIALLLSRLSLLLFPSSSTNGLANGDLLSLVGALGRWNLIFLLVASLPVFVRLYFWIFTWPKPREGTPRAVHWLLLQRPRANVQRTQALVRPIEPYIQAASVLRSAGQIRPANRIELERLRLRRNSLSWRFRFVPRTFLLLADMVAEYGLGTTRVALFVAFVTIFGAMGFHQADQCGYVWATDGPLAASANLLIAPTETSNVDLSSEEKVEGGHGYAADTDPPYPAFVSFLYSVDVVVPFLDLGQQSKWTIEGKAGHRSPRSGCFLESENNFSERIVRPLVGVFTPLLQMVGWLLTTVVAIALGARLETILARKEE